MLKKERFSLGNNGSTLVEVIVSVLIVGIAFIPLMMGLNAAMNTNKQTENKLFAEAACDNVVEVCKTYGSSGLIGLAGGSGEGVPSFSGEAIKKLSDVFSGWDVTYSSGVGGVTNFTVTGITEGDRGYTALVEFDPGPYKDGQNNYDNYQMIGDIGYAATVTFVDDPVKKIAKYFCDKAQVTAPDVKL